MGKATPVEELEFGAYRFNLWTCRLSFEKREVLLTTAEKVLFRAVAEAKKGEATEDYLLKKMLEFYRRPSSKSVVRVHGCKLRKKIRRLTQDQSTGMLTIGRRNRHSVTTYELVQPSTELHK